MLISNYDNLTISASFSINGYPSLATSTPVKISQMYVEPISSYSVSQNNYLLGSPSDISISIPFSSQVMPNIATIEVLIPQ